MAHRFAMRPDALLLDLDGTLLDSVALILASYHHTLAEHGCDAVDDATLAPELGTPLGVVLARFATDADAVPTMIDTYRDHNRAHHDAMVRAYDGMPTVVEAASRAGVALGIVTNKSGAAARQGLDVLGIRERFGTVVSADDVDNHKPHPEPVLMALDALGVAADRAVFVGDSPHDLDAGAAAGVRTGAALWGPFPRASLEPRRPAWWFTHPSEILDALGLR